MTFSFGISGSLPNHLATPEQEAILRQAAAKVGEAAALLRAHGITPSVYATIPTPVKLDGSTSASLTL